MNRRYFSLVELLTVITIIVILAGIAVPVVMHMSAKGKETKARAEMNAIKLGLTQFKSDYGVFPVTTSTDTFYSAGYSAASTDESAIDTMLQNLTLIKTEPAAGGVPDPYTSTLNTKKLRLLDVPAKPVADLVKLNPSFMSNTGKGFYILDPWGRRYSIALDTDYDGKMTLPTTFTHTAATETVAEKIAIFSYGSAEADNDTEAFLYTWKTSAE